MNWLAMGGYGQFVWPAYALALLAVGLNIVWARRSVRRAREEVRRRLATRANPNPEQA